MPRPHYFLARPLICRARTKHVRQREGTRWGYEICLLAPVTQQYKPDNIKTPHPHNESKCSLGCP